MGESNLAVRLGFLLALMAALLLVEAWIPFRARALRRQRLVPNLSLTVLFFALNLALTAAVFTLTARRSAPAPVAWVIAAFVLALDFFAYLAHVLMHKVPALWRVHRVHHSDREVDVTTALRQHPLETALRFVFTVVPAIALGMPPEAVALYRMLSGANALFEHANVRVDAAVEQLLCWMLVTPPMHKVHHSRASVQTDSNYSNIFSVFDRLFGTLRPGAESATVRYGLDEFEGVGDLPLGRLLRMP